MGDQKQGQTPEKRAPSERSIQRFREEGLGARRGSTRAITPFGFMRRMVEDMDRLFGFGGLEEELWGPEPRALATIAQPWSPEVEVFERDGDLVVRADLPGLDQKDVNVDLDDDGLTIRGERRVEHEQEEEGYFHSERSYGSFLRRIPLPRDVDRTSCDAVFENGVLEIKLKLPEKRPSSRNVPIRAGGEKPSPTPQQKPSSTQNGPSASRH